MTSRYGNVNDFDRDAIMARRRFFETIRERLAGDGYALVHSIGVSGTRHRGGRVIDKYVFPLVNLPSIARPHLMSGVIG